MHENTRKIAAFNPELAFRVAVLCDDEEDDDVAELLLELPSRGVPESTMPELLTIIARERPQVHAKLAGIARMAQAMTNA